MDVFTYFLTLIFGSMIAVGTFMVALVLMDKILFQVDFWQELKKKNMAVAVFLGALVIAIAIVVTSV